MFLRCSQHFVENAGLMCERGLRANRYCESISDFKPSGGFLRPRWDAAQLLIQACTVCDRKKTNTETQCVCVGEGEIKRTHMVFDL